jgi:hypothetical protein
MNGKVASNLPPGVTDKQLEPYCEEYGTLHCREKCPTRETCPDCNDAPTLYEVIQQEIARCKLIEKTSMNSSSESYAQRRMGIEWVLSKISIEVASTKCII